MNLKSKYDKRNYIIIALCAVLVVMGVGYAAFSQLLTINGTANISNSWNIEITNIRGVNLGSVQNNGAYDKEEPQVGQDKVSATFHTGLISPGDTRIYEVEVTNKGSVDADITSVFKNTLSDSIYFSYDGVGPLGGTGTDVLTSAGVYNDNLLSTEEPFSLPANTNNVRYIYITVKYRESVTSQPTNLEATINLELNAEQAPSNREEVDPGIHYLKQSGLEIPIVTSGDGLYDNGDGQYIYKGANPYNYLEFNNEIWRIVRFDSTGIKIIKDEKLDTDMPFDTANTRTTANNSYCNNPSYGCNVWSKDYEPLVSFNNKGYISENSSLEKYLNEDYLSNTLKNDSNIVLGIYNVGPNGNESKYTWPGKIALLTAQEYKVAAQDSSGTNYKNNNYLKKSYIWWLLSLQGTNTNYVSFVTPNGDINNYRAYLVNGVRPVLYLSPNVTLTGNGTNDENIYRIS